MSRWVSVTVLALGILIGAMGLKAAVINPVPGAVINPVPGAVINPVPGGR
jgi:hypothetical protein